MGLSLKTDMQMLGLSNPKMFSFFLRIMAYCPLSLGDLKSEGGSPGGGGSRMWERAGGRGTRQISGGSGDNRPVPVDRAMPPQPLRLMRLEVAFQELEAGIRGKIRWIMLLQMCTDSSHLLH